MIKILIKESILREVQISDPAVDEIYNFIINYKQGSPKQTIIKFPFKHLPGMHHKDQQNGLVIYAFLNLKKINIPDVIKKSWNKEKKEFSEYLLEKMFNDLKVEIVARLDMDKQSEDGKLIIKEDDTMVVSINYHDAIKNGEFEVKQIIRHELEHISQVIPYVCLKYGHDLSKTNDPALVQKKTLFSQKAKYAIGSNPTGLSPYSREEVRKNNISAKDAIERYYVSDDEFETWMSDLTAYYFKYLEDLNLINRDIASRSTAKDLAKSYVDTLTTDDVFRKKFARSSEKNRRNVRFMDLVSANNIRSPEFKKKFPRYLAKKIQKKYSP